MKPNDQGSGLRRKLILGFGLALGITGALCLLILAFGRSSRPNGEGGRGRERSGRESGEGATGRVSPELAAAGANAGEAAGADDDAGDAAEPPPLRLRGRVTGEGAGIAGASVLLFSTREVEKAIGRLEKFGDDAPGGDDFPNLEVILRGVKEEVARLRGAALVARTDAEGAYEFRGIEPENYLVLTLAGGWLFRYGDVVSIPPQEPAELDQVLQRGASISGRVVDSSGDGVAGATVTAEFRPAGNASLGKLIRRGLRFVNGEILRGPLETTAAADGSYTLTSLPPGAYDLAAARSGMATGRLAGVETGSTDAVIPIGKPAWVEGFFVDAAGAPLPDIDFVVEARDEMVTLPLPMAGFAGMVNSASRLLGDGPSTFSSGREGKFRAGPIAAGEYRLIVERPGFLPFAQSFGAAWGETTRLAAVRLDAADSIAGIVRSQTGLPLAGARVRAAQDGITIFSMGGAMSDMMSERCTALTDASGAFRIGGLPGGQYHVTVRAAGHAPAGKRGVATGGEPVAFELRPGADLSGRVIAAPDGKPLAGARVEAQGVKAETDAEGRFLLASVASYDRNDPDLNPFAGMVPAARKTGDGDGGTPPVNVTATARGYLPVKMEIDIAGGEREIEIEISRAPEITGTVLDPQGKPAPGALVRLAYLIPTGMPGGDLLDPGMFFLAATVTNLEGKFRLREFRSKDIDGQVQVMADHPLHARAVSDPMKLGSREGEAIDLQLQLVAAARIKGMVTDGERPVAGASVRLSKASREGEKGGPGQQMAPFLNMIGFPKGGDMAYTDAGGKFEYARVPPGDYVLGAERRGFSEAREQPLTVAAGEERELTLVVDPGGAIRGRVVDPAGVALGGARLRLLQEPKEGGAGNEFLQAQKMFGGAYKASRADDDGRFLFEGIPPGSYLLIGQSPGHLPGETGGVSPGPDERQVVLAPASILRGIVADRGNGAPITRFRVEIKPAASALPENMEKASQIPEWEEHNDVEGRFAREDLAAGLYRVRVRAAGYVTATAQVSLASGAAVEERFLLAQGGRVRGAAVDLQTRQPIEGVEIAIARQPQPPPPEEETGPGRKGERAEESEGDELNKDVEVMTDWFRRSLESEVVRSEADGAFLIESFPEGVQALLAEHPEYIPERKEGVEVHFGEEVEVVFALRRGLSIAGKVVDEEGAPGAGRMVFLRGTAAANAAIRRTAMADASGEFRFAGLEKGPYRLSAPRGTFTVSDRDSRVDISEAMEVLKLDVEADQTGIEVKVRPRRK